MAHKSKCGTMMKSFPYEPTGYKETDAEFFGGGFCIPERSDAELTPYLQVPFALSQDTDAAAGNLQQLQHN